MTGPRWRVRLGGDAERDFVRILAYTKEAFGERYVETYTVTLIEALAALEEGPNITGSAAREEILPSMHTLHVARKGRRGRHFILYRTAGDHVIEVVRILHDQMDLARHIPKPSS